MFITKISLLSVYCVRVDPVFYGDHKTNGNNGAESCGLGWGKHICKKKKNMTKKNRTKIKKEIIYYLSDASTHKQNSICGEQNFKKYYLIKTKTLWVFNFFTF